MKIALIPLLVLSFALFAAWPSVAVEFTDQGEYLGSSECMGCHGRFYELWSTSHHGKAMQAFSGAFARTLKPMKKPMKIGVSSFIVELNSAGGVMRQTDADGAVRTYPVLHALGGKNVYFFLVPLDKGKLQVAPLAYNVHTEAWYDSTGSMVRHFNSDIVDEALDWTDRQLTFNAACHDCHISQLRKNYDPETDSYQTTWTEPGINCEVCHGPGEAHVAAAKDAAARGEKLVDIKLKRFHKDLDMVQRDATCAPCHAKMNPLTDTFIPGELFFDHYDLTGYEHHDFYPDGRDLGENYTQTGWLGNPCAQSGQLECIHCHTSSGRFRFKDDPNQSCLPCHQKRVDTVLDHSHHELDNNVSCVDCHMPKTAQAHMHRSDHTFRSPSPAASLEFGSPNACNLCHHNKEAITGEFLGHDREDAEWAANQVVEWHGKDAGKEILEMGRIIQACRDDDWEKLPEILAYLDSPDADQPTKVGILRMLTAYPFPYPDKWATVRRQLDSKHEWVRSAAADALRYDPSAETTEALLKAAKDEFRTVRIRAASSLIDRDLSAWGEDGEKAFATARDEYWNSLVIWPDRWSTYYNQGLYFDRLNQPEEALKAYEKSRKLRNDLIPPVINASMVYARSGDSTNACRLLKEALEIDPNSPMVHFNLALLEAEFGNIGTAETHLRAALENDPDMAQAAYNLGVLLCRDNRAEGLKWLHTAAVAVTENWNYTSSYLFFLDRDGRMQEIESVLLELVGTKRASPEAYFTLIGIYQREGRTAEAMEICKKVKYSKWLFPDAKRYAAQIEQTLEEKHTR